MKKIFSILLVITALSIQSCEKFLEEDPQSMITPLNFYKSSTDAITAVNAVYIAALRNEVVNIEHFWLNEMTADDAYYTGTAVVDRDALNLLTWDNKNKMFETVWANRYKAINRANEVLLYVNSSNAGNVSARVRAEASFMRAFCYFDLVRWFGSVPLITDFAAKDPYVKRSSVIDIYHQIIEDLKVAETDLENKYDYMDVNGGRATKGAAKALLGKVYLTMAGAPLNKTEMYAEAEKKLKEVIDNKATYGYEFMPIYRDIFPIAPNDANKKSNTETIFYTRCNSTLSALSGSWSFNRISLWTRAQGFRVSSDVIASSDTSSNAVYTKSDLRRKANLAIPKGAYPTTTASPYTLQDIDQTAGGNSTNIIGTKYLDIVNGQNGANDFVWLRYTDVLLMYAETLIEQNKSLDLAKQYINMTRNRGGIGNTTATTQTELRNELRLERRREFFFEGQRRFDLIRWNTYLQAVKPSKARSYFYYKKTGIGNVNYMDNVNLNLFPIPNNEMITNPNMTQNTGY